MNATPTGPARRPPTPPPSPSHEHLGLEWDPSVDIGRSLSHDDADSSYFSVCTGLCQPDETKRWSYLSSFDSRSDITADITNQEAALEWTDQTEPGLVSPVTSRQEEDQWAASSPEADLNKPMRFDGGRVKAWLRVQSSAPAEMTTSCSRAVQTDGDGKEPLQDVLTQDRHGDSWRRHGDSWRRHGDRQRPLPAPSSREPAGAAIGYLQSALQEEEEPSCSDEEEQRLSEPSRPSSSSSSALLFLLLAAALALLAGLILVAIEPPCHRGNRMPRSLHLTLSYVNGPPPT